MTVSLLICDFYISSSTRFVSLKLRDFPFSIPFRFIKVYTFAQQNVWTLWLWNVIIPFKIKIIEKPLTFLFPDLSILSCNKKF